MDYIFYKAEDFITDEYFIQWVKQPSGETDAFWNAWISQHPEKEIIIREARQVILALDFKTIKAPKGKSLEIWQKINEADNERIMSVVAEAPVRRSVRVWLAAVAACFFLGVGAFVFQTFRAEQSVVIQTQYAELRSVMLPDSTKVILNANSQLRYENDFETTRQVWLTGEGFFVVKHKKDNQNFRVHTDDVEVEVLGTKFNVNTRRGKSQIVLEEGSVKLGLGNENAKDKSLILKPGDMATINTESKKVERKVVEVDNYSSWRVNKLTFVGSSLKEIAQLMEDNYGYQVVFQDAGLRELKFTGSAALDNPGELLQKLSKIFDLTIKHEGKKLVIQAKH